MATTLTRAERLGTRALGRRASRRSFEEFFRAYPPQPEYQYGRHTLAVMRELDRATKRLERGRSTYLIINVMYRHGKSDLASRRWPVWHLGRNPDHEFILATYNDELATDLSYDARACFREAAGELWGLGLSQDRAAMGRWRIDGKPGALYATGIGGTITGRGAHVLGIDDYLKNREEAESRRVRNRSWESFTNDLMTRLAPQHVVVITATRWHEDDIVGRIRRRNDPKSKDYDPRFPKFRVVLFPAWTDDAGWLFPERFGEDWYEKQRAQLATYAWQSEGQQDPRPRTGNLLKADRVQFHSPDEFVKLMRRKKVPMRWGWDLASTTKEVATADPDYTVGTWAGAKDGEIFVGKVVRGRWRSVKRNKIIRDCALATGRGVLVRIEAVAGYKDAADEVRNLLSGAATVEEYHPTKDKVARYSLMEAPFELCNVHACEAEWNAPWIEELLAVPSSAHDDQADGLDTAVHDQVKAWDGAGVVA